MIVLVNTKTKTVLRTFPQEREAPVRVDLPDGSQVSPVTLGWTKGDFAVYSFVPFVTPSGKMNIGSPSYGFSGQTVTETCQVQDIPAPVLTRVSKYDVSLRLSEDEGNMLKLALLEAPGRLQFIWESIQYVDHNDPLFPTLRDVIVDVAGEQRATVILEPTE